MAAAICQNPSGKVVTAKDEMKYNIYQMTYEEVKQWDCGSKGNEGFPEQEKNNDVQTFAEGRNSCRGKSCKEFHKV